MTTPILASRLFSKPCLGRFIPLANQIQHTNYRSLFAADSKGLYQPQKNPTLPIRLLQVKYCTRKVTSVSSESEYMKNQTRDTVSELYLELKKQNISLPQGLSNKNLKEIIAYLLAKKVKSDHVVDVFSKNVRLLHYSPVSWNQVMTLLQDYGFSPKQSLCMASDHSGLWIGQTEPIFAVLETIRALGFQDGDLHHLTSISPGLFLLSPQQILKRHKHLLQMFSKQDCLTVILNNPSFFTDNLQDVEAKFHYVFDDMGLEDDYQIIQTRLLSHSQLHICARHMFLVRAGLYKRPTKRDTSNVNQSLRDIMDSNDGHFAKKIAGLSLKEYQVFKELYAQELEQNYMDDMILESDDDEEEEDKYQYEEEEGPTFKYK